MKSTSFMREPEYCLGRVDYLCIPILRALKSIKRKRKDASSLCPFSFICTRNWGVSWQNI